MPQYFILMMVSGVLVILGVVFLFWGRNEEKKYYDIMNKRIDEISQKPEVLNVK